MSRAAVFATLAALIAATLVFWVLPQIDIAVAQAFFIDGTFFGTSPWARAYRAVFYYMPLVLLALCALAYGLKRRGGAALGGSFVSGRGLAFLALSMALGPGLLVNVVLKDNWHRPRPAQIAQFGGPLEFRPFWRGDGGCQRNCSFVSGEVSANAWLIAPASLVPPPFLAPAMAAALAATVLAALGRMAFGGHFLSDALFAAIFTFLLVQGLYWAMFRLSRT